MFDRELIGMSGSGGGVPNGTNVSVSKDVKDTSDFLEGDFLKSN